LKKFIETGDGTELMAQLEILTSAKSDLEDLTFKMNDQMIEEYLKLPTLNIKSSIKEFNDTEERDGYEGGEIVLLGAYSGCVDEDTEYFNGVEWKKMSDYIEGEKVLSYDIENKKAILDFPVSYHHNPEHKFYHFKTKYGIDMMLTPEHRVYYQSQSGCRNWNWNNKTAKELADINNSDKKFIQNRNIIGGFDYNFGKGLDYSNEEIDLCLAAKADANINNNMACFNLKKKYKIDRIKYLCDYLKIRHTITYCNGYTRLCIPLNRLKDCSKHFGKEWHDISKEQAKYISERITMWDGDCKHLYRTTNKSDADFVQFIFAGLGYRTSINVDSRKNLRSPKGYENKKYSWNKKCYCVGRCIKKVCNLKQQNRNKIELQELKSDSYCFRTKYDTLILRRNNCIFITGNCGKTSWMLQECVNVVKQGFNVGCFILGETYQHEVVEKILSYLEDKPRREVKTNFKELYKKNESTFDKITFLNSTEQGKPISVHTLIRNLDKHKDHLDFIIIDYDGKFASPAKDGRELPVYAYDRQNYLALRQWIDKNKKVLVIATQMSFSDKGSKMNVNNLRGGKIKFEVADICISLFRNQANNSGVMKCLKARNGAPFDRVVTYDSNLKFSYYDNYKEANAREI
jgi:hypothetical protein